MEESIIRENDVKTGYNGSAAVGLELMEMRAE
jgi:hypothetical protein